MKKWTSKHFVNTLGFVSSLALLLPAFGTEGFTPSQQGYFIAAHGGAAFPSDTHNLLNTGYTAGGEYGYTYDNYRTYLQADYTHHDYQSPSTATYQLVDLMINLVYDFNYAGHVIPFLGGGFGYMRLWSDQCSATLNECTGLIDNTSRVSYQGVAGLGFRFKQFRIDLRYRYLSYINNPNNFHDNIPELVLSYYFFRSNQLDS